MIFPEANPAMRNNVAFSLIELSVVLVIIGLLIGGVLVGKTMIRQARVNTIATDVARYVQAAKTFTDKYGALPGDFSSATNYWNNSFNGNGDGVINSTNVEMLYFWNQLSLAALIEGSYSGVAGSGGAYEHVIGVNCPESKIKGAGFGIQWVGIRTATDSNWFAGNYGHMMIAGAFEAANWPGNPGFTPAEVFAIDTKFDDGLPGYGNIVNFKSSYPGCVSSTDPTTATYNASSTGNQCSIGFVTGF